MFVNTKTASLIVGTLLALQLNVAHAADDNYMTSAAPTPPPAETQADVAARKALKGQLVDVLTSADPNSPIFDKDTAMQIAGLEMKLAQAYLKQGDRKNAIVYAVLARQTLQQIYNNPNDPRLIQIYSLLVQVYSSEYDKDDPTVNKADAAHAKMYRDMIYHIHSM